MRWISYLDPRVGDSRINWKILLLPKTLPKLNANGQKVCDETRWLELAWVKEIYCSQPYTGGSWEEKCWCDKASEIRVRDEEEI